MFRENATGGKGERDREERDVKKEREANQMIFEFNYQIYSVSGFLKTILFLTPQS